MALFLPDISLAAVGGAEPNDRFDSLVRQLNEWGRIISSHADSVVQVLDRGEVAFTINDPPTADGFGIPVKHNLGYAPVVVAYIRDDSDSQGNWNPIQSYIGEAGFDEPPGLTIGNQITISSNSATIGFGLNWDFTTPLPPYGSYRIRYMLLSASLDDGDYPLRESIEV